MDYVTITDRDDVQSAIKTTVPLQVFDCIVTPIPPEELPIQVIMTNIEFLYENGMLFVGPKTVKEKEQEDKVTHTVCLDATYRNIAFSMTMRKRVEMPFMPVNNIPITDDGIKIGKLFSLAYNVGKQEWHGMIMTGMTTNDSSNRVIRAHKRLVDKGWSLVHMVTIKPELWQHGAERYTEEREKAIKEAREYFVCEGIDYDKWTTPESGEEKNGE